MDQGTPDIPGVQAEPARSPAAASPPGRDGGALVASWLPPVTAGFVAVLVGFTSSAVIVFQAAAAAGGAGSAAGGGALGRGLGRGLRAITR